MSLLDPTAVAIRERASLKRLARIIREAGGAEQRRIPKLHSLQYVREVGDWEIYYSEQPAEPVHTRTQHESRWLVLAVNPGRGYIRLLGKDMDADDARRFANTGSAALLLEE